MMFVDMLEAKNWTDDLPVCPATGIGLSTNQVYKGDGHRREARESEDRSFHFKIDEATYLYGVFNGTDGSCVADFAVQRMPVEILLGQLNENTSPTEVKEVLREAFYAVERSYFESVDDLLAERMNLMCELPEGIKSYDAYQQYPETVKRLQVVNTRLSANTSAAVALIFKGNLYVANAGNCRGLLCKMDDDGVLRVIQLTVDHDLTNEDELLRLSHLDLDVDKLRQDSPTRNTHLMTRCLGNYTVKGGYKDFDLFSQARAEPVVAEAEISGPIPLDESCRFLMLMTHGLYGALEEATGCQQSNKEITQIVVEQFGTQSTLTGVAQGVVDRVVRIHHDKYMQDPNHAVCSRREDITLLVRNFNFQLADCSGNSTLRTLNSFTSQQSGNHSRFRVPSSCATLTRTSLTSSESSVLVKANAFNRITLDEQGKVEPYVDFTQFYQLVEHAKQHGIIPQDELY